MANVKSSQSADITIKLTETERKVLGYIAADPEDWINSFVKYRLGVAVDEIYAAEVARLTAEGAEAIPTNKMKVVEEAFASKKIVSVKEANEEFLKNPPIVDVNNEN